MDSGLENTATSLIVGDIFEKADAIRATSGEEKYHEFVFTVVVSVLSTIIMRASSDGKYQNIKKAVESVVASSFMCGMGVTENRLDIDFICQVHRIGPPLNKLDA